MERIVTGVDWSYYDADRFSIANGMYLPASGEGDTMATQLVTALNKLIYKWYNDGDVYDNRYILEGWANDLSSYANWIYKYIPGVQRTLDGIQDCYNGSEYEDLLRDLADECFDLEDLEHLNKKPAIGSIYDCDGPFAFDEYDDDDDDEWYDEDEEDSWV